MPSKDFNDWNHIKQSLETKIGPIPYFKEGEVWWVRIGLNVGVETDGKGDSYVRPVLILKKYNQFSFLGIPLTTSTRTNKYRVSAGVVIDRDAIALLSQLRNMDSKRLGEKMCFLDRTIFEHIRKKAAEVNFR